MMGFGKKSHMLNPMHGKRNSSTNKYSSKRKSMCRIKHDLRVEHHNNNQRSSSYSSSSSASSSTTSSSRQPQQSQQQQTQQRQRK